MKQNQTEKVKKRKKSNGIPTWGVVLPLALVLAILHTMVAGAIVTVSRSSAKTTDTLRVYGAYMDDVTEIQGTSSRLNETSFSFLLRPVVAVTPAGPILNSGPLYAYTQTLQSEPRATEILKLFESREIGEELMGKLNVAAECAESLVPVQLHAIALVLSVYPLPESDDPENQALAEYLESRLPDLTEEELNLTDEQRLDKVIDLISGTEYSAAKRQLSTNISEVNRTLQTRMQKESAEQQAKVSKTRGMLISATALVMATLLIAFFLFIRLLVVPLRIFVRRIDEGTSIPSHRGLAEVRLVARSYNAMMKRKDALEGVLRSAAETDSLTGLPNRYYMEQYLLQLEEEPASVGFFLFDVNFLKKTNDEKGHLAGDALLQRAAKAISACAAEYPEAKCFRYGGDEFVGILKNCREEDVEKIRARFEKEQKNNDVSVAVGYAYSPDVTKVPIKELFDKADSKMYEDKKRTHGKNWED